MEDTILMRGEHITRLFRTGAGTVRALENVTIQVKKSALTVLRGRSGSGKTTLLNILSGLDTPTEGQVFFKGKNISALSANRRDRLRAKNMGFVFQAVALMPDMNAIENVEYGLRIAGCFNRQSRRNAEECLNLVGLGKRMKHLAQELSGGEQQRVAIARALAKEPKLLLCDEPTGALDYNTGKKILKLLQDTCREQNMTVVIVTHNTAITPMADRVIHMRNGAVTEVEVNAHPRPVEEIEW